jgi:hypothetical protein
MNTTEELNILIKAEEIRRRIQEEEKQQKKQIRRKNAHYKKEQRRLEEEKEKEKKHHEEVELEKKRIQFNEQILPTFLSDVKVVNEEIQKVYTQLYVLENKKNRIKKSLREYCIHSYGKTYDNQTGTASFRDCIYCGYSDCVRECCL